MPSLVSFDNSRIPQPMLQPNRNNRRLPQLYFPIDPLGGYLNAFNYEFNVQEFLPFGRIEREMLRVNEGNNHHVRRNTRNHSRSNGNAAEHRAVNQQEAVNPVEYVENLANDQRIQNNNNGDHFNNRLEEIRFRPVINREFHPEYDVRRSAHGFHRSVSRYSCYDEFCDDSEDEAER